MNKISINEYQISPNHYINGKRVASPRTFTDISPIDGRVLGEVSAGGQAEVDAAVAAAKAAFPAWAALGPEGRLPYLERLAHVIEHNAEMLPSWRRPTTVRCSKPACWCDEARRAQHPLLCRIRSGKAQRARMGHRPPQRPQQNSLSTGWGHGIDHPLERAFMLSTWKVGPAQAAGNTVVLKPPDVTAHLFAAG